VTLTSRIIHTGNTAGAQRALCIDGKRIRTADCYHCVIRKKMLFSDVDLEQIDSLLRPISNLLVKPGTVLYQQGEPGLSLYSVRKGLVKLVQSLPNGFERIVHIAGPGACIGMEGFLNNEYGQRAEALTEADVCAIPVESARRISEQQTLLFDGLMARWQSQFELAGRWMLELSQGTVRQKLARLLLMLDEIGHTHGQIRLLNNQDSAGIVGSTVETVSRNIADFKREGFLQKMAPALYAIDRDLLQNIAVTLE
jgi:CRP-like cAMP-binding protein